MRFPRSLKWIFVSEAHRSWPLGMKMADMYLTISIIGQNKGKVCAGKVSEVFQNISISSKQVKARYPWTPLSFKFADIYILFGEKFERGLCGCFFRLRHILRGLAFFSPVIFQIFFDLKNSKGSAFGTFSLLFDFCVFFFLLLLYDFWTWFSTFWIPVFSFLLFWLSSIMPDFLFIFCVLFTLFLFTLGFIFKYLTYTTYTKF